MDCTILLILTSILESWMAVFSFLFFSFFFGISTVCALCYANANTSYISSWLCGCVAFFYASDLSWRDANQVVVSVSFPWLSKVCSVLKPDLFDPLVCETDKVLLKHGETSLSLNVNFLPWDNKRSSFSSRAHEDGISASLRLGPHCKILSSLAYSCSHPTWTRNQ